jgi:hypothetical protein
MHSHHSNSTPAQVEAKRLAIAPEVPLAVQQWTGIIAVNYPARKRPKPQTYFMLFSYGPYHKSLILKSKY